MHRFKEAVDKDPYDTLFGWSNDMLRGRPFRPRWFMEDELKKPWSWKVLQEQAEQGRKRMTESVIMANERFHHERMVAFDGRQDIGKAQFYKQTSKVAATETNESERPSKRAKVTKTPAENISVKTTQEGNQSRHESFQAYSQWSIKSTDNTGKSVEQSGASVYDPISGRMVPVHPDRPQEKPVEEGRKALKIPVFDADQIAVKDKTQPNVLLRNRGDNRPSLDKVAQGLAGAGQRLREQKQASEEAADAQASLRPIPTTPLSDSTIAQSRLVNATRRYSTSQELDLKRLRDLRSKLKDALSGLEAIADEPAGHDIAAKVTAAEEAVVLVTKKCGNDTLKGLRRFLQLQPKAQAAQQGLHAAKLQLINYDKAEEAAVVIVMQNKIDCENAWMEHLEKRKASVVESPHFRQNDPKSSTTDFVIQHAYRSLHRHRNSPLKHMSAHQLANHRAALLQSWQKRGAQPVKTKSAADKRLEQEIAAQKNSYAAWENKWSKRPEASTTTKAQSTDSTLRIAAIPTTTTNAPSVESASQPAAVPSAEGDMCPNVIKYCKPERLYKRKAPHATIGEDPELARSIKQIYEETYGTIDENHRQPKLNDTEAEVKRELGKALSPPTLVQRATNAVDTVKATAAETKGSSDTSLQSREKVKAIFSQLAAHRLSNTKAPLATSLQRYADTQALLSTNANQLMKRIESATPSFDYLDHPHTQSMSTSTEAFRILTYDQSSRKLSEAVADRHPDGWSSPRVSNNTAIEILRSKPGYLSEILPNIQRLQKEGFVLYDLSRDDRKIIFKHSPRALVPQITANPVDTSLSKPSPKMIHQASSARKAAQAVAIARSAINPVDPALRQVPPQTQTGNFASPTGFVNLETPDQASSSANTQSPACKDVSSAAAKDPQSGTAVSPKSKQRIRRQETVYSGGRNSPVQRAARGEVWAKVNKTRAAEKRREFAGEILALGLVGTLFFYVYSKVNRKTETTVQRGQETRPVVAKEEEEEDLATSTGSGSLSLWQAPSDEPHEQKTHPVALAFVEAATLSLTLAGLAWAFLSMLEK